MELSLAQKVYMALLQYIEKVDGDFSRISNALTGSIFKYLKA